MFNLKRSLSVGTAAIGLILCSISSADAAWTRWFADGNSLGEYACRADGTASSYGHRILVDCNVRDTKQDGKAIYAAVRFIDSSGRWSGYKRVSANAKSGGAWTWGTQHYMTWDGHNIKGVRFYLAKDVPLANDVYYTDTRQGGAV
jgi:hypothetical protein